MSKGVKNDKSKQVTNEDLQHLDAALTASIIKLEERVEEALNHVIKRCVKLERDLETLSNKKSKKK